MALRDEMSGETGVRRQRAGNWQQTAGSQRSNNREKTTDYGNTEYRTAEQETAE